MSHTTVDAEKVLAACDSYLKQREELIEKRRAEMVEKARRPLWRRILRLHPISEERARRRLAGDTWSSYNLIDLWAGREFSQVKELRSLAIVSIAALKPVTLDDEHAYILENHWR